ncbi:hypothetical protein MMC13_005510 [Lambiella insularis]|nr:hypothetical protein [Lambiella insularis]
MRAHSSLAEDSDANAAASEAFKGAAIGAVKYGLPLALLSVTGLYISPVYRALTIQFKLFIQMSGMTLGGMIEADHRLREYEALVRVQKKRERDEAVWQRYETLLEEEVRAKRAEKSRKENAGR